MEPPAAEMNEKDRKELRSLIVAIRSKNTNNQLHGLTQLKILSSADARNKVVIREEGTIGPTVALLGSENVKIQLAAVRLLRSLSVNEENQQTIADENGIPPLINLLESPFAKLQLNAAATLWNLSVNDDNKRKIAKEGAIRPLIFLLDSNNIKVQNEACGALRNLSFNDKNQRLIGKDGGITLLLDLLKSDDENLKRNSAITLNNLTSINEENKRRLRKEGGIELLINVLLANDINVLGFDPEVELKKRPRPDLRGPAGLAPGLHAADASAVSLTTEVFDSIVWHDIKIEKKIGSGAYGDVYKARYHGYPVAVKVIKESLGDDEAKKEKILEELKLMAMLKHPNVVLLMGACLTPDSQVAIVTEYCARGNLKDTLKEVKSLPMRLKLAKDIVAGLNWLHSNNIIHRDLKLANLLVSEDWQIKITDFGLSLHWYEGIVCHHFKGNVKYSAPEILRARSDKNITVYNYGPQTDVYSFGLMLWELTTCMPLFPGVKGKQNITTHVLAGNRPEIYEEWPKSLKTLLALCWHEDPNRRPLFREIQDKFDRVIIDVMCFGRDTPVLRADGRLLPVQHVAVGDRLLGDDGRSVRTVHAVTRGRGAMARVEELPLSSSAADGVGGGGGGDELAVVDADAEASAHLVCNTSHLLSLKLAPHVSVHVDAGGSVSVTLMVTDAKAAEAEAAAAAAKRCDGGVVAVGGGGDDDDDDDGAADNRVTRIVDRRVTVRTRRDAHRLCVALGGAASPSHYRTLADAARDVDAHLRLGLGADALAQLVERSTASGGGGGGGGGGRLAFDAAQRSAIKQRLRTADGLTPVFADETVDVAVRHVLDAKHVSPAARAALVAYRAPALTFVDADAGGGGGDDDDDKCGGDGAAAAYALGFRLGAAASTLPDAYKYGSAATRRRLLAGVLAATGGSLAALRGDAAFVARSLGLGARRARIRVTPLPADDEFFGFTVDGNGRVIVGEQLAVSHNCPDPTGRRICKKLWKGQEMRKVGYEEFEESFLEKTRLNLKLIRHIHLKCLTAIICCPFDDTITMERFCNAVAWFGPMYPVEKFLERIRDTLQKDWFHGFVNSNKAAQLLKTRWSSTSQQYFLYRFSLSTPGCFALTFIDEDGTIVHKRISHSFNSSFALMNHSPPLDFPSLEQLHTACRASPDLLRTKKTLPGSMYRSLFE